MTARGWLRNDKGAAPAHLLWGPLLCRGDLLDLRWLGPYGSQSLGILTWRK